MARQYKFTSSTYTYYSKGKNGKARRIRKTSVPRSKRKIIYRKAGSWI